MMKQQIVTYEELYDHMTPNGIYLCEDIFTSYYEKYGGGYKHPHSFIEYTKNFIDALNVYHFPKNNNIDYKFRNSTYVIHYYDGIIVLEKRINNNVPISTIR